MSPVKSPAQRNPRSVLLGIGVFAFGSALILVLFVLAIPKLTESGRIEVKLGSDRFDAGFARNQAGAANEAPLLFSDVSSGERDIFLVHTGSDDLKGWVAFDARKPGTTRDCSLQWDRATGTFKDPCDGSTVSARGEGLPHYPVEITRDEHIVIDLNAERRGTTTTTSLLVTGTTVP